MRQTIISILLLCGCAIASLTACTKVPEWSKPAVIYGKNYKKAADELPQADDYVPVSKVPERPSKPDLSHVFEELGDKPEGKLEAKLEGALEGEPTDRLEGKRVDRFEDKPAFIDESVSEFVGKRVDEFEDKPTDKLEEEAQPDNMPDATMDSDQEPNNL